MSSLNQVSLIGNLGKDTESRTMQNGGKIVTFSVATTQKWNDKQSGERKERTEWHRIVVYNEALAGVAERYLRKGSKVYVQGGMETRKYTDKSDVERTTTEVVLRAFGASIVLLGDTTHESASGPPQGATPRQGAKPGATAGGTTGGGFAAGTRHSSDLDDDIPFGPSWQ